MTERLILQDLRVRLGGALILRGVDFTVLAGRWFGILGANGSGKTTMLRALNGRLPIDAGRVLLDGVDVTGDLAARAGHIGFAPPPDSLPVELTAAELIGLVAEARGADPDAPAAMRAALDIPWLGPVRLGEMSAGMRQRVCLYTAFIGDPAVVLLDEPFNWLDPVAGYDLKVALRAWTDDGGALVTALHDIAAFATRCDEGLLLHDGRVVKAFTPDDMAVGRGDVIAFEHAVYEAFKTPASS